MSLNAEERGPCSWVVQPRADPSEEGSEGTLGFDLGKCQSNYECTFQKRYSSDAAADAGVGTPLAQSVRGEGLQRFTLVVPQRW